MANVMNTVFGIGVAVILFVMVLLGISVFYPSPNWSDYNCTDYGMENIQVCNPNITVGDCYKIAAADSKDSAYAQQKSFDECNKTFEAANKIYGKNFFIIASIIGVIIVFLSMLFFFKVPSMANISAGTALSGLVMIFTGFVRGWQGTNDKIKFFLAVIIAAMIIAFAVIVNRKYSRS